MQEELRNNNKLKSWIVLNVGMAFMFCIFAPIEILYANLDEFWFSLGQLLTVCVVEFIILFCLLSIAAYLLSKTKVGTIALAVSLAFFIISYIQGNFIPRNYGVLNGEAVDWGAYSGYATASIVLFLLGILIVCIFVFKASNYLPTVAKYLSVFIISIQVVTIATLMIQNGVTMKKDFNSNITTQRGMFELSQDNNVIVFLLDAYDTDDFDYLLTNDSENQEKIFENFTYYRDTLGCYPTTKGAMPFILTGEWYQNEEPYKEYVKNAYIDNSIYKTLETNAFSIDMYEKPMYLSNDNSLYGNVENGTYLISDYSEFAEKMGDLVLFNYMPHQLKKCFLVDTEEINDLKKSDLEYPAHSYDVIRFAEGLGEQGLSVSRSGNLFKFYHIFGVHVPSTFGKDLKEDGREYTSYDEAAGNNEILKRYFEELKENGIYDQSTIVILADHGHTNYNQNPIFLIKNARESHDFTVSDKEMSYEYLRDIWISIFSGEVVDEKYIENEKTKISPNGRRFLYYNWDGTMKRDYLPAMEEMYCKGVAYEPENLNSTGNIYLSQNKNYSYSLGETLEFIDGLSAYDHVLYGIADGQLTNEAKLIFDISEQYNNLSVEIQMEDGSASMISTITANDTIVAEIPFDNTDETISFIIPGEYISDGHLELVFNQNKLGENNTFFSGSGLIFKTIRLSATDSNVSVGEQMISYNYELGTVLGFTKENPSAWRYIKEGFSLTEDWGTWTSGKKAELYFQNIPSDADSVLELKYNTFNGKQHVKIYCNDILLYDQVDNGFVDKKIRIPASARPDDTIKLTFEMPDADSPYNLGINEDTRVMALGFESLVINEEQKYSYGSIISFESDTSNSSEYIVDGFSTAEQGFTWTDSDSAELLIPVETTDSGLVMDIIAGSFNVNPKTVISVNGEKIGEYVLSGQNELKELSVNIPSKYTKDGLLDIVFEFPDARSPYELGISSDKRKLSLSFVSMKIDKQ